MLYTVGGGEEQLRCTHLAGEVGGLKPVGGLHQNFLSGAGKHTEKLDHDETF